MTKLTLATPIRQFVTGNEVEIMRIERANSADTDFVEMYVNPQRITIRQRKVMTPIQTNARWVFQHWGYEPVGISYSGVTGYINNKASLDSPPAFTGSTGASPVPFPGYTSINSPYYTNAYKALAKLRQFYESPQKELLGQDLTKTAKATDADIKKLPLILYYRDSRYSGYLTRMDIQEEETSPWMWSYSMEYLAYKTEYKYTIQYENIKLASIASSYTRDDPAWEGDGGG